MRDPVSNPEGNSCERAAIEGWLQNYSTSPLTRTRLAALQLNPNRCFREAIEDYVRKAPMATIDLISSGDEPADSSDDGVAGGAEGAGGAGGVGGVGGRGGGLEAAIDLIFSDDDLPA